MKCKYILATAHFASLKGMYNNVDQMCNSLSIEGLSHEII